jgi:hypothetical protein
MSQFTLLLIIGLASTACQILFALSVHRLRLILFSLGASLLFLVQYLMLEQWLGFWSGVVGTGYTLLLALAYRWPVLQARVFIILAAAGYVAMFLCFTMWDDFRVYQAIPLVAGIASLIALRSKNLVITKSVLLAAGVLWLTYEFSNTMYTQMIGESFEWVGNLIALSALMRAKRLGISERDMLDIDTQAISVLTGAITLPKANRQPAEMH